MSTNRLTLNGDLAKLALVSILLATIVTACQFGDTARESLLSPAAKTAWASVMEDADRGLAAGRAADELDDATLIDLQGKLTLVDVAVRGDAVTAATNATWELLIAWARRGVQDRVDMAELGAGGATSFNERIDQFTAALAALVRTEGGSS